MTHGNNAQEINLEILAELSVVELERVSAYGTVRIYPANATARLLAQLTRNKTFSDADLAVIVNLGYSIKWRSHEST